MTVYVESMYIGEAFYEQLQKDFPNVKFQNHLNNPETIEVMIAMPRVFEKITLDELPNLKWFQSTISGYDKVNIDDFTSRRIIFCNAQETFATSIAEDVFAKIFYFNRNIHHYMMSMKEGLWEPIYDEPELMGSHVLIVGVGSIGKTLAKRLKAFDVTITGYRRSPKNEINFDHIITSNESLEKALTSADYVILALPLNHHTKGFFNKRKFDLMKRSALLINVARGQVVVQEDLIQALLNKEIRGAGLDVVYPEPLPKDHILWSLENVYITPHNASSSPYTQQRIYQMVKSNLERYIRNEPVHFQITSNE